MADWSLDIPFKDRDDLVLDTITAARETFGEDDHRTQLVEVLANDALLNRSITTVGGLLDELGGLSQAGTRRRLDWAREQAGLVSATEADRRREDARFESAWQRTQPPGSPEWSEMQGCHAKGCNARPTTPEGALRPVSVERWWCPQHEHLAAEGDLEQHESPYRGFSRNGKLIPTAKEAARIAEWVKARDEAQERERQKREEHDEAVAEATEAARERYRQEGQTSVLGVRVRPDLRVIR
jgi:hypothetical protein